MGIEYWILKCPTFISHTDKQNIKKFSIEVRLFEIKYLKTKTKTKNLEIYMKFSLKIGLLSLSLFFLQSYSEMKMKIKEQLRSIRGL